jgi:predicted alpha/beta-fold hydrolase
MPIIKGHIYTPPSWLINGHFDTIFPALFRKVTTIITPEPHMINTPDQDYFDLNFYDANSDKTVIISHGLEGNNSRPYVLGNGKRVFKERHGMLSHGITADAMAAQITP